MAVWDDADDLACLLPMQPLRQGRVAIRETFRQAFQALGGIDIQAAHLQWLTWGDTAVHLLEEQVADRTAGSPRRLRGEPVPTRPRRLAAGDAPERPHPAATRDRAGHGGAPAVGTVGRHRAPPSA